ncbi:hypothetical protein SDC9_121866 [bioreactor metagenome]|uniref:Uncharacterized protein n=1 Tax=bioreactor metagenome TaxID=1076179 RepID=A0A645CD57_9ZZZZ|nr:hypothetical protein [Candidatus Metalachnospira sp.]
MKRLLTVIMVLITSCSVPAYAKVQNWDLEYINEFRHFENSDSIEIEMKPTTVTLGNKTQTYYTFDCVGMKYVPLRKMVDFLGRDITYSSYYNGIYINDLDPDGTDDQTESLSVTKGTAKVSNTTIFYNGTLEKNKMKNGGHGGFYPPNLNFNGSIYVPLKTLTEAFGFQREYGEGTINIFLASEKIKQIPGAEPYAKAKVEFLDEDDERVKSVDQSLIDGAMLIDKNKYGEPWIVDQKSSVILYEGKLSIRVETEFSLGDIYLLHDNVYEIVEKCGDIK